MKYALAIPHTPWIRHRVDSLDRLLVSLSRSTKSSSDEVRFFTDREPNHVWSQKLWQWGHDTGADYLVQLQDDALVAPCFWGALDAMLTVVPDKVIGLHAVHPAAREAERAGFRWHRANWLYGVGYVIPKAILGELVAVRATASHAELINEDEFIGRFCAYTKRDVWCPIPTIIDHDITHESTYGNDDHTHRRPAVTWRGYSEGELTDPAFWITGTQTPLFVSPHSTACWFCGAEPGPMRGGLSGARIGWQCLARGAEAALKRAASGV